MALGIEVEVVNNISNVAIFLVENHIDDTTIIDNTISRNKYDIQVVEEEIQYDSSNTTIFLILTKKDPNNNSSAVSRLNTTMAFLLKEGEMIIFKALLILTLRDIKVNNVESLLLTLENCTAEDDIN